MDGDTGLAILGAAVGSKDIVARVFGPTADYLGVGIQNWTERRVNNVARIVEKAHSRLGDRANSSGSVHPKVLKEILDEGSYSEDELAIEYFGGVLASSRSGVSRDDRGASFVQLVARLSAYQLRSHFLFYHLIKSVFNGTNLSVNTSDRRFRLQIYIPFRSYISLMEFSPEEDADAILAHVLFGLANEDLIDKDTFHTGPLDSIRKRFSEATEGGMVVAPTARGVELFHWAHGLGHVPLQHFLATEVTYEADCGIPVAAEGVMPTHPQSLDNDL